MSFTSLLLENIGAEVPVQVRRGRRANASINVRADGAILRLPLQLPPAEEERLWRWAKSALCNLLDNRPELLEAFCTKPYADGDILQVGQRQYVLHIEAHSGTRHSARIHGSAIFLKLADKDQGLALQQSIRTLLSRIIAKDQLPALTRRVFELNALHFRQQVKSVRLRYNRSSWGTCSRGQNLTFSTRLLFAPSEVQDYVIIHELAHLIEFNHSPKFWKLVADADPQYKQHARWLKEHGSRCKF